MLTVYAYDRCSTCRKALKWLDTHDLEYTVIDITTTPPPEAMLQAILRTDGFRLRDLFNTSGVAYREMNMSSQLSTLDESAAVALLASHGRLVKRPIVTDGKRFTVGYREDVYASTWG